MYAQIFRQLIWLKMDWIALAGITCLKTIAARQRPQIIGLATDGASFPAGN